MAGIIFFPKIMKTFVEDIGYGGEFVRSSCIKSAHFAGTGHFPGSARKWRIL